MNRKLFLLINLFINPILNSQNANKIVNSFIVSKRNSEIMSFPVDLSRKISKLIYKNFKKNSLNNQSSNIFQESATRLPVAQYVGKNFIAATSNDTPYFPPDSMGAVGPTQYIMTINGLIKSFSKSTGKKDNVLNTTLDNFFNLVINGSSISDPRIRYDFFTKRWFIVAITVDTPNRIVFAFSDTSSISNNTTWNFFYLDQNDFVSGTFADYPTFGIDNNALYVGANVFDNNSFNTEAIVIPKNTIFSGIPTAFSFTDLINTQSRGIYTPQGVDNFDPNASTGYFAGVDAKFFGILVLKAIFNPGTTPTISDDIYISVKPTTSPLLVPHKGNLLGGRGKLDAVDDRLMVAHIRNNKLWTVQNIGVNNNGISNSSITRNGCRWYQINLSNNSISQSGTLFAKTDTNSNDARYFWMPSIMTSGQNHAIIGCSTAGTNFYINAAVVGRLSFDAPGTLRQRKIFTKSSTSYNPPFDRGSSEGRRWGDYSNVSLDPNDNMSMWTIQEYCGAKNEYTVRVAKINAPPPATPISVKPSVIKHGLDSINLRIKGKRINGSGFYDPGIEFPKRLQVVIGKQVQVLSVTFINPLTINVVVSTKNAIKNSIAPISIINPDGQKILSTELLTIK